MAILKMTLGLLTAVTLTSAATLLVGCSSQPIDDPTGSTAPNEHTGSIGLALQAAPGFAINTVSYAITGPKGFSKAGTIDVSNSTKISALIGPLPVGKGFSVTLSADAVGGVGSCTGSASFDIVARQTTPVTVRVTCHEAARSGSVLINGQLNVCPVVDGLSASPGEVAVGGSIALGVTAHDSDAGPKPLRYLWKASSGTLSNDAVASPTFTCTVPGSVVLSVSVSDGDPTADCADTSSLVVECSQSCEGFNRITAALGELTADCRGTVDPRDYGIDDNGRIAPNFQSCPADPNNERGALLHIKQLLSIQRAPVPNVVECTAGRFKQALEKFSTRGINVCPTWSKKNVLNPPTPELIKTLSPLLPVLLEEEQETTLKGPFVPPPELDQLKIKSSYTVTLPPGTSQQCSSPADCATACAEAFPGFVLPSLPGTPKDTILVDPDSWWSQEFYGASGNLQSDPNNMDTAFYHQMGFVLPTPGDTYGALARWNPCNATVVNSDAMGQPFKAALTTSTPTTLASLPPSSTGSTQITTECQSEKCNYYIGGYPDNPIYVKTKLQRWCADTKYADQSTCLAFCGRKLAP
jgi:hypothetical protein